MSRPSVTVVVPFAGSEQELTDTLDALGVLRLAAGDEVRVADNTGIGGGSDRSRIEIVPATGTRTPGFARNRAAAGAGGEWLLFLDADTRPTGDLLDRYFAPEPDAGVAVLAGAIRDVAASPGVVARHRVAREHLSQSTTLHRDRFAYAQTANCAIRREAFESVGGFDERARAGEDADLCFRLVQRGWQIEERPAALVEHRSRETLRAVTAQLARHGSGAAWLNRRYPGSLPPVGPAALVRRIGRSGADAVSAAVRGERERALFALLDIASTAAFELGRALPNETRPLARHRRRVGAA